MIPKKFRLNTKQFGVVFEKGHNIKIGTGRLKVAEITNGPKISCVAAKSEEKSSQKRNRLRRRGYGVVENHIDKIPENLGIIWFLPAEVLAMKFSKLDKDFEGALIEVNTQLR